MPLRRKVRGAAAAGRRAAVRWWLLSLAATGATVTAAAALLAVALHVSSSSAASGPASSSGVPYRLSKLDGAADDAGEKRWWLPAPSRGFTPCVAPSPAYKSPGPSRGYLLVLTNGGLNQMRAGPLFNISNFSDVFDEEYFIHSLANDVKVEKKLPKDLVKAPKFVRYFKSWSGIDYYHDEIYPLWEHRQVIRAAKSDSRLANNYLPPDIQKLRCRAFFQALRFAPPIEALGNLLVERMRSFGPYIALHLRYEKDMLAFSGCTHGLSQTESEELAMIRENTSYWKVKDIDPLDQRSHGYCPLTPKEVGMFLSALGYPSSTPVYIAAGEIYGGESHVVDLLSRFPIMMNKEKLASAEELRPFRQYASQMAALDYIVSVESDVFIPSYSGNMARAVGGHRRFLGHRKTIIPDRKALVRLFDKVDGGLLNEGERLSRRIIDIHRKRQGSPRKRKGPVSGTKGSDRFRSEEAFYENPLPDCLCQPESPASDASVVSI
uniref:O-fucosyltransferase family protein n=1 Tax=Oryza glumipatula TaxID=40148 RepID=A0A0E0A6W3_9ORYZ